ncbi:GNAT family N-acetyltransferase [Pseudonocardia acaciae]|uniref:GNAT family N-acetyltransferase n=1 Tax=Pseudonocardia acaciae TaxID=551276 RepID=UPI0004902C4B|nr:GNAT family N-acetyltransferase [Pseudonocardia acaciae]
MPHRPAHTEDVPALRELARRAYAAYVPRIGREPAPMAADYAAAVADGHVWVAEDGDRIAGLLVLIPEADHLLLENVAVDPDFQGTGVGAELLALAETQARSLGLNAIRLYTNEAMTENLAYYPRRGYVETHRAAQDGFNRVFFTKSLS